VDYVGWVDVLVPRISVLVFVLVVLVAPVVFPGSLGGVSLSIPLRAVAEATIWLGLAAAIPK